MKPHDSAVLLKVRRVHGLLCRRFGHRVRRRGLSGPPRAVASRCTTPTKPGSDSTHLSREWRIRRQTPLFNATGDIPRGRVQSAPARDVRRRRGQESCPRTREMPPVVGKSPRPRRMSPSVAGRRPRCTAGFGGVAGLRLGRAARPGQLAHAGSPRRAAGPALGRYSPRAWPPPRRRAPAARRSAHWTVPAP